MRRRAITTLAIAQLCSGVGGGAALGVGSLMAVELTGNDAFAGAVTLAISIVATLAALPLARLAMARGRRVALSTGLVFALLGAIGMTSVPVIGSFPLLMASAALLGMGNAANLQARFAAADLSTTASRARDLSFVQWSITIGAVGGPNLIGPGARLGELIGLPAMSGPFLFSAAGVVLALIVLNLGLRPDPLSPEARARSGLPPLHETPADRPGLSSGLAIIRANPSAMLGVVTIAVAQLVMVAIMSLTPVHLTHVVHGHPTDVLVVIGLTISLHIAGMFALSPLVGWAADRLGRHAVMLWAQAVLAASLVVGLALPDDTLAIKVSLVLLGVGWSMAIIAGSAFVSESVRAEQRVAVQGLTDMAMSSAGALGALLSGVLLAVVGFTGSNVVGLVLVVMLAVLLVRVSAVRGANPP